MLLRKPGTSITVAAVGLSSATLALRIVFHCLPLASLYQFVSAIDVTMILTVLALVRREPLARVLFEGTYLGIKGCLKDNARGEVQL